MRVEAPRGEVFYYIETDGSDVPSRIKVRTPTFANIPTVVAMVKGNELADVPLIQAVLAGETLNLISPFPPCADGRVTPAKTRRR